MCVISLLYARLACALFPRNQKSVQIYNIILIYANFFEKM